MRRESVDKWIVWQQHYIGYKPRKFGSCASEAEAVRSAASLNQSPSAQWYSYHVEFVPRRASTPSQGETK